MAPSQQLTEKFSHRNFIFGRVTEKDAKLAPSPRVKYLTLDDLNACLAKRAVQRNILLKRDDQHGLRLLGACNLLYLLMTRLTVFNIDQRLAVVTLVFFILL